MKYLKPKTYENYWALDIETDDLNATKIWVACVKNLHTEQELTFYDAESFNKFRNKRHIYVTHNGISFDVPVLNRLWGSKIPLGKVCDTLVLSYLYEPNLKGGHSLDAWGRRLGDKKIFFKDWSKLSNEMVEYCRQDVNLTGRLYLSLCLKLTNLGYSELSASIEHRYRHICDIQQRNGFSFNRLRASLLYLKLRELEYTAQRRIRETFEPRLIVDKVYDYKVKKDGTPYKSFEDHKKKSPKLEFNKNKTKYRTFKWQEFNLGSFPQRVDRLKGLGWVPTSFTPKGNPKVDEESILAFAEESQNEAVALLADWLVYNGRANMIRTWLNNLHSDGKIHGTIFSCGAGSRRCTHASPNTANVPAVTAKFGAESRACWTARPGRVLVGADASGLEGRVFIHYLGSKEAEEFMLNDPHSANAAAISEALGRTIGRGPTKNLFYARLYGATDFKLGSMVGRAKRDGERIRTAIDSNIPGFQTLVETIEREFNENNQRILTIDGGFVRCPSSHAALNYKFQSCGAVIMKKAAIILDDLLKTEKLDVLKVGDIHDEWQFDCRPDHANRLGELACKAMTLSGEALKINIKIEGEYSVGRNWAETH